MEVMREYILSRQLFFDAMPGVELSSRQGHFNGTIVRRVNTKALERFKAFKQLEVYGKVKWTAFG
jgi:hypothetical protein